MPNGGMRVRGGTSLRTNPIGYLVNLGCSFHWNIEFGECSALGHRGCDEIAWVNT